MPTAAMLLRKFNSVKTLPHVAIRLSKLISDEKSTMQDFEKMIRMDPTLVLRLLRLVNSPYYGLKQKVDSISRAVVFIGMKNLRNLIVTDALKEIFREDPASEIFSRKKLWLHCAAVSICSQMISERIFGQEGENAFLCGILHDIGMIVEDQVVRERFLQFCNTPKTDSSPITQYERSIIGTDHCQVGHLLSRDWNLPVEVQEGIKRHHSILEDVSPSSITGIAQISEYIVSKLDYPAMPGMDPILSPPLADHLRERLQEYRALAKDLPDEMSKAKELYESPEE